MSPTNQDLSNDTTFSQIKSRVPVPLSSVADANILIIRPGFDLIVNFRSGFRIKSDPTCCWRHFFNATSVQKIRTSVLCLHIFCFLPSVFTKDLTIVGKYGTYLPVPTWQISSGFLLNFNKILSHILKKWWSNYLNLC